MFVPDPFDIIAILLGIFLALRKSDVRSEDPARYPEVAIADFDRWRARAISAYSLGIRACFAKVIADYVFLFALQRVTPPLWLQRAIGVSITLIWVALLIGCWLAARRARRLADELRIGQVRDAAPSA